MSKQPDTPGNDFASCEGQQDILSTVAARSLLDQLLTDSQLYKQSKDYKELLDFVIRLRNFAPFNAMLLQLQKPGLSYAASATDWQQRFGRKPKDGVRPLLILWPFGPVALVYDVMDTEGRDLPEDVASFFAHGSITEGQFKKFITLTTTNRIQWNWVDAGDRRAGSICVVSRPKEGKQFTEYQVNINRNHSIPVQFATLTHELGHLFLGHLGPDKKLKVPLRYQLTHSQREFEAESVAYLVCERNGVKSKSQTYLANYVEKTSSLDSVDLYQIMRAAGQVEALLELTSHARYK